MNSKFLFLLKLIVDGNYFYIKYVLTQTPLSQSDQSVGSLKEELKKILPQLEEMRKRKFDRRKQFLDVLEEIRNISNEIQGSAEHIPSNAVDETDLSLRKLEELHRQLHALQKEKVGTFFFIFYIMYHEISEYHIYFLD